MENPLLPTITIPGLSGFEPFPWMSRTDSPRSGFTFLPKKSLANPRLLTIVNPLYWPWFAIYYSLYWPWFDQWIIIHYIDHDCWDHRWLTCIQIPLPNFLGVILLSHYCPAISHYYHTTMIIWFVVERPLWKIRVTWDDEIPNIWRNKHVPKHQPTRQIVISIV